jgi:hypothetical protein
MMRKISTKAKVVAVGVAGASIAMSGVAYAYWTTTGSGTGSASTTADVATDAIQLSQVGTLSGFYPGSTPQNVVVKSHNPAAFSQKVGNVTVVVSDAPGCGASNWAVVDSADAFGTLLSGATSAAAGQTVATLALKETGENQDGCKSVSPTLTFTSAPDA